MEASPEIFIASSSEGNAASNAIEAGLKRLGGPSIVVRHWKTQFQLSKAYIESLEAIVSNCDFGLFVLTADDFLNSRKVNHKAPRDNVIFEMGLFMGALGRSRCFIFVETNKGNEVKVPSDLLGLEKSEFVKPAGDNWEPVLTRGCRRVLDQVSKEGKLYRLPENLDDYISFRTKITGYWWNMVSEDEPGSVAFIAIKNDAAYNSIKLNGTTFSDEGKPQARWETQIVSLLPKEEKLIYHWTGTHMRAANFRFSGFGEINFESEAGEKIILRANSRFFDINEAKMEKSQVRVRIFRREINPMKIKVMLHGPDIKRKAVIEKAMKKW